MIRRTVMYLLFVLSPVFAVAQEIGYIEEFSLARDRPEALKQLIPGSEEYYYYHCLHYQNTEQFDRVDELMQAWIKRYKYTSRVIEIQNRQALLTYPNNRRASLEHIRKRLNLQFNHQRETIGEKPNLPTVLDPDLISRDRLTELALARHKNLDGFEDSALDWLIIRQLDPDRRRFLLQRLPRPDHSDLPKFVVADLNHRYSKPFGSMPIHRQLLTEQLDACLLLKPDLLNQTSFVTTYIGKLRPSNDDDWQNDLEQYVAYLDRLSAFVDRLAPAHNSLKAHVLYHRLIHDRSRGVYDKARFMKYIQLPRRVGYIEPRFMQREESRRYPADLNADFRTVTLLDRVGDDEALVRSYLHHFFVDETTTDPYKPYINDVFLRRNFAETKIVNGLGEPEQWYSMLNPSEYQALKDRIDLDFAFTNPRRFASNDQVSLDLFVKNVRTLIVKVYEINTQNYYRTNGREVNTDVNLDGLVPNEEYTFDYTEPPLIRARRHFEFTSLGRPGVYVVDFIGNGMSSRAVVRKGRMRHLLRTSTAGQVFTVLDEDNHKINDASIWIAGHEYTPAENGEIVVPFSSRPGRQPFVITRDGFSSLGFFNHQSENYQLIAGMYIDRESLLTRRSAELLVRPALLLNGSPVSLWRLEDVRLNITSTDQDGVVTRKQVKELELFEDRELTYELQTPPRLSQIHFQLSAKIDQVGNNKKIDVQASESFVLNQINLSDKVEDLHLAQVDGEYFLDLLGKSGEARPDRPVQLQIKHRDFRDPVNVTLQSDLNGRVALGALEDIATVSATGPEGTAHIWQLGSDKFNYHESVHGVAGEPIRLPYMGVSDEPSRAELSLLELRGNSFVSDWFSAIDIKDGMVEIKGLPRGDFDLLFKRGGHRVRIRLAEGTDGAGYVLGRNRQLELRGQNPLQISRIEIDDENVHIHLENSSKFSRVHVFATRYQPAFSVYSKLAGVSDVEPLRAPVPKATTLYSAGRNIGDEYRYIIDRRYANKYPGVMLERPSLLLNPWPIRSTQTSQQKAMAGDAFAPEAEAAPTESMRDGLDRQQQRSAGGFANLDFLADTSAVMLNLTANDDGVVSIPQAAIGAHSQIHVVAVDPLSTAYRSLSLPDKPTDVLDLRLVTGLDPERHFTQQKKVSAVGGGEEIVFGDVSTARFEAYDSLARVYSLFTTLSNDSHLNEFRFILDWLERTPSEKQELYSKYASHELNFFLYKKDKQFFTESVRPFLQNKRDKTFLDKWLLDEDLGEFLQPWNFAQLNIVERILLSQRIDDDRQHTVRDVSDLYDLLPIDLDRTNFLFQTALKGSALDKETDAFGVAGLRFKSPNAADFKDSAFGMPALGGMAGAAARQAPSAKADRSLRRGRVELMESLGRKKEAAAESFFEDNGVRLREIRQLYEKLDKTQEWVENNYYRLPIEQQVASLVPVNAFWRDYARHNPDQPFLSAHLAEASRNFPEMMFALSVIDLPFTPEKHETQLAQAELTLTAASPMVVYHEEIREAGSVAEQTPILVSQNFYRHGDRYQFVNNQRLDKFVTDEFLVHTVYGCQVVITNPTSAPQKLDVLLQIPVGAIPVLNGHRTRSTQINLEPYHTQTVEYHFYFPAAGEFPHYPVHVAKNEDLLAHATPVSLRVVEELSRVDRESWQYVSQNGREEDVLNFLKQRNLHRVDLDKIAFRMQDDRFFQSVVDLLEQRHVYNHTIWSYAIKHDVPEAAREFLQHADAFVNECGAKIDSPLLAIDPVIRKTYQHMDYRPLVNARVHQLGRRRHIVNARMHQQYHRLLEILSYERQLENDDLMAITYYLLVQDRISEAIEFFDRVNAADLSTRLQYDYFAAYLSLCREDVDAARQIVSRHVDEPIDRWRNAFVMVSKQLDEIQGADVEVLDPESRDQTQTKLAASEPSFDFQVESKEVRLTHQNLDELQVNYYLMDIELLFSRNPFVQQYSSKFSYIRPNMSEKIQLANDQSSLSFPLPEELHNANVLVEIIGGGQTKSQPYFSNSLALQVVDNYGQLRLTTANPGKPIAKAYVKVYAQMNDGSIRFYKDGYTDLRGRFDYSSLNTNALDNVRKFSLLVMSGDHGAVVREAMPPKQ